MELGIRASAKNTERVTRDQTIGFEREGFRIVEHVLTAAQVQQLIESIQRRLAGKSKGYGLRHLTKGVLEVAELAHSPPIRELVEPVLGAGAFVVQSLFFDKTPEANWNVAWHQDLMIAVENRVDDPQYGPWSSKEGVWHVQPPAEVLERILIVRLHLDNCFEENGALRVLPGSHTSGRLSSNQIDQFRLQRSETICSVARGGALVMRPLLLHASSRAKNPAHRRVIHLEFAAEPLPGTVKWLRG
jgi:ectoine hydroxylase-related dioxygenase (phytanoyl-CoA dioxygenase family)